ncbi:MAG: DUF4129 domain-containing protein [Planctomycetaceae bacterium]|nr:DUF4129 domain-containing protein [Planctomycetaceae bacterium]
MADRPRKTLTDYLVIAISPALIMTLIGSLTFFLLEVFYQGRYQGRLEYIFTLFIVGATLIGRISIEEGRERAVLFAVPLGLVTLLAVQRFVEFQDPALASWSLLINLGIIALVGWAADKLTWDCTLIDETEEDSGAGLLETVGFDHADTAGVQAETTMELEPESSLLPDHRASGWWDRFVERRRQPHAPGVWVVYFSLAAVALFGIGQLFIPAEDQALRRYAFQLLCVYTVSGLSLLLTTSFLGLRRYLRQRRQAMPGAMTRHWLTLGVWLIVGVMVVAMVLPRPDPEYAVSEWPHVRSPEPSSSRHAMGRESAKDQNPQSRRTPSSESKENKSVDEPSDKEKQPETSEKQEAESQKRNEARPASGNKEHETSERREPESPTKRADDRSPSGDRGRTENPLQSWRIQPWLSPLGNLVSAAVVKWIVYGALVVAALGALWTHRHGLAAAVRQFWRDVLDWWGRWFGGWRKPSGDSEQDVAVARRSFADFADPFAAGLADRWSPAELVRYSFEALEAWAADRGCPRASDQTPHEFVRRLASRVTEPLAKDAHRLAELYCQAAYARRALSKAQTACVMRLWQQLNAGG